MTATAEPPSPVGAAPAARRGPGPAGPAPAGGEDLSGAPLAPAGGVELLGRVQGSGYRDGAALVRRADGQMVRLGPLMYGLLECMDGRMGAAGLAEVLSDRLGRTVGPDHVIRLAQKLAAQGLVAGSEHLAPPRRNPLLALRWKVLVTNTDITRRLTAPFTVLFRGWIMWPVLAAFAAVFWFVLVRKGVASATSQAFHSPGLLLLVFALGVLSAGFHEFGHAAACRYSGATPGGMGMGLYLVWPAFYTDVTDAYRLPRRDRLRIDLAGLYFNAVVAVATMVVWLFWRVDALLLLVALQILQMVKQLSPIIRADGYHILSDATGVPDLYAHMGPTMRRLLPGHRREPSALTGRARLLVTLWVLIVVPVLISLMVGAILLLPHLAASAWDSGRLIARSIPHQVANFQVLNLLASLLSLLALALPVAGSALVSQKVVRSTVSGAWAWSAGRPGRRAGVALLGSAAVALLAWAWWPSGQYQPVRASQGGTLPGLIHLISSPGSAARPASAAAVKLSPGTHLAVAMVPADGASRSRPAIFFIPGTKGQPPAALLSFGDGTATRPVPAAAFPFQLPGPPGPHGTQALAVGTRDGGVTYNVAYALVTVSGGAPVDETNSAYALADCRSCTTVAVSFQVVLVVGQSDTVAPVNAAGALNYNCLACNTTAIADQIVVTLSSVPTPQLISELEAALQKLNALPLLGAQGSPQAIAAEVAAVQDQITTALQSSGLLTGPLTTATTTAGGSSSPTSTGTSATTVTTVGSGDTSPTTVTPTTEATPTTTATSSTGGTTSSDTSTTTTNTSGTSPPTVDTTATTSAP
ncbi:MAG TPA: hypothetical protein VFH58_00545 [Acidimicrobiales bacterium]|nr:hypothetical protein [Acidimicrobiales bacterium]